MKRPRPVMKYGPTSEYRKKAKERKEKAKKNGDKTYITFCSVCDEETDHYLSGGCATCKSSMWYRERQHWWRIKDKYGLSQDDCLWMLKEQNYQCKICGREIKERADKAEDRRRSSTSRDDRIIVDHDHKTMRVRGMLCNNCNLVLGHAMDDVTILNSAIRYLEETV